MNNFQFALQHINALQQSLSDNQWNELALSVFRFQVRSIPIYNQYVEVLNVDVSSVQHFTQIPFLPIRFFKTHRIYPLNTVPELMFESSGTTGKQTSTHSVLFSKVYQEAFKQCFSQRFGSICKYEFIGLLPSYLERPNASLVYMVKELMSCSLQKSEYFYLNQYDPMEKAIESIIERGKIPFIFGVTFALLDWVAKSDFDMPQQAIIVETGGMKGRGKDWTRAKMHHKLQEKWVQKPLLLSEYGMTELLSQSYTQPEGALFECAPSMKVLLRETEDPFTIIDQYHRAGAVNIIDLYNIFSCCFIATDDLGQKYSENTFDILGRIDHSDTRGCNAMVLDLD